MMTGPVLPRMVRGCPLNREYETPQTAVATIISVTPTAPPVSTSNKPPNAMAGAKQAKNKKNIDAKLLLFSPSVKSEIYDEELRFKSAIRPPANLPVGRNSGGIWLSSLLMSGPFVGMEGGIRSTLLVFVK